MSKILCVIDGMTDPQFCAGDFRYLSAMKFSHNADTAGNREPETLNCVLHLLGVSNPPEHLRGYAEALGAGIPVQPGDLILRGSWFALDGQRRCTLPCQAPDIQPDPRFRYYPLGRNKAILIFPNLAHMAGSIATRLPSGVSGQSAEGLCPEGCGVLSQTFKNLMTSSRCLILWGQATAASLPPFPQPAAVICGKEIVKGIARLLGMDLIPVPGATGDVDTDLDAKTDAALAAAREYPFVLLHINGTDEAAHRKDPTQKKMFLRQIDNRVISRLLQSGHEIEVAADHGSDPQNGTHMGNCQPVFTNRL